MRLCQCTDGLPCSVARKMAEGLQPAPAIFEPMSPKLLHFAFTTESTDSFNLPK